MKWFWSSDFLSERIATLELTVPFGADQKTKYACTIFKQK